MLKTVLVSAVIGMIVTPLVHAGGRGCCSGGGGSAAVAAAPAAPANPNAQAQAPAAGRSFSYQPAPAAVVDNGNFVNGYDAGYAPPTWRYSWGLRPAASKLDGNYAPYRRGW